MTSMSGRTPRYLDRSGKNKLALTNSRSRAREIGARSKRRGFISRCGRTSTVDLRCNRNQGLLPLPARRATFSSVIGLILPPPSSPPSPTPPLFHPPLLAARGTLSNGSTGTHARNGFVFLSYISPFYFAIKHFHITFTWRMKVPSARAK